MRQDKAREGGGNDGKEGSVKEEVEEEARESVYLRIEKRARRRARIQLRPVRRGVGMPPCFILRCIATCRRPRDRVVERGRTDHELNN